MWARNRNACRLQSVRRWRIQRERLNHLNGSGSEGQITASRTMNSNSGHSTQLGWVWNEMCGLCCTSRYGDDFDESGALKARLSTSIACCHQHTRRCLASPCICSSGYVTPAGLVESNKAEDLDTMGSSTSWYCWALPSQYLASTGAVNEQEGFDVQTTAVQHDRGYPHIGTLQSGRIENKTCSRSARDPHDDEWWWVILI